MTIARPPDRRYLRTLVVMEHMESENVQDWDRTIATFSHPRYELPDGQVIDGREDVVQYWLEGRTEVPDQRNELIQLTHHADQVVIEFWLRGTPAGRSPFERRIWAVFDFDADDLMTNERVYLAAPTPDQVERTAPA